MHQQNDKESILSFSKPYVKEVFGITLSFWITILFLFAPTISQLIISFLILFLFSIILLFLIGVKRRRAIEKIATVINQIKANKNVVAEDIILNSHFAKIERDLRTIHIQNQDALANMQKLAQTRTEFLGNVSHELRTPIFAIQGFLETLLNGALNDKEVNERFVKKAMHHTKNLNALLNDLIDISMIESGQMRMQPTYFNIGELINSVVDELQPLLYGTEIKIKIKVDEYKTQVFGDKEKIKQVFINLISNAIKYSEKGTVYIKTNPDNDKIIISVKDSGYGIAKSDMPRVFERFYRVDKARSKAAGGTGLGLAIVKHIVEAHGSKIEVTSKLGKGSTFLFSLRGK